MRQYQVKTQPGAATAPLHMVAYWKCESCQTDVRLDYKFNAHAQATPAALRNLMISIPIEGAVTSMHAKPQGEWQVVFRYEILARPSHLSVECRSG